MPVAVRRSIPVTVRVRVLARDLRRPPPARPRARPRHSRSASPACAAARRRSRSRACCAEQAAPRPRRRPRRGRRRRRSPPTCASMPATASAAGPLGRRVHYLPGWEVPPFEPLSPTREIVAARAEGLYHLLQTPRSGRSSRTVEALGQRCLPRAVFADGRHLRRRGRDGGARRPRRAARRVGLPPRAAGAGSRRPGAPRRHPRRLPGRLLRVRSASSSSATTSSACASSIPCRSARSTASRRSLLLPVQELGALAPRPGGRRGWSTSAPPRSAWRARSAASWSRRCAAASSCPGIEFAAAVPLRRRSARSPTTCPPARVCWMLGAGAIEAAVEAAWAQVTSHAEAAQRDGRFFPPPERLYLEPARVARRARRPPARRGREPRGAGGRRAARDDVLDRRARRCAAAPASEGPLAQVAAQLEGVAARAAAARRGGGERDAARAPAARCSRGTASRRSPSDAPFPQALARAGPRRARRSSAS